MFADVEELTLLILREVEALSKFQNIIKWPCMFRKCFLLIINPVTTRVCAPLQTILHNNNNVEPWMIKWFHFYPTKRGSGITGMRCIETSI